VQRIWCLELCHCFWLQSWWHPRSTGWMNLHRSFINTTVDLHLHLRVCISGMYHCKMWYATFFVTHYFFKGKKLHFLPRHFSSNCRTNSKHLVPHQIEFITFVCSLNLD
jgi:hypothetical protein